MSDLHLTNLAKHAEIEYEAHPEVLRSYPAPLATEMEVALAWLVKNGVSLASARIALTKAVLNALKDDRDWLNALQGFVNKAVRENWPTFKEFSGEWLKLRAAVEAVRDLEAMLDEADD